MVGLQELWGELFIKEEGAELKYGEDVLARANVDLEAAGGSV